MIMALFEKKKIEADDKIVLRDAIIKNLNSISKKKFTAKNFNDFSWTTTIFLKKYFAINYEFSHEELCNITKKARIRKDLKNKIIALSQTINEIKYGEKELNKEEFGAMIDQAQRIVNLATTGKESVEKEVKEQKTVKKKEEARIKGKRVGEKSVAQRLKDKQDFRRTRNIIIIISSLFSAGAAGFLLNIYFNFVSYEQALGLFDRIKLYILEFIGKISANTSIGLDFIRDAYGILGLIIAGAIIFVILASLIVIIYGIVKIKKQKPKLMPEDMREKRIWKLGIDIKRRKKRTESEKKKTKARKIKEKEEQKKQKIKAEEEKARIKKKKKKQLKEQRKKRTESEKKKAKARKIKEKGE